MIEHNDPFPIYNKGLLNNVSILNKEGLKNLLWKIYRRKKKIAFDFETTGKKPYKEGHKIVTASISTGSDSAFAFPWFNDKEILGLWKKIMLNPDIKKIGWNIKFEDVWSREILGYGINGWEWDGMLASHILDNREQISSLGFQTYARCGILGFKDDTEKYLTTIKKGEDPKSDLSFNRIDECDMDKLLIRNGLDSLFEYKICEEQQKEIQDNNLMGAYELFEEGSLSFSQSEFNGINIDNNHYEDKTNEINIEIKELKEKIQSSRPASRWKKAKNKELNVNSNPQMTELLFKMMELKPPKTTAKGNASVDDSVIEILSSKVPMLKYIQKVKKLEKLKNTFIRGITRETYDNKLHPFFNLHTVSTMRSSSSSPNFQNNPERDEYAKQAIKGGIIPRQGYKLKAVDYGGMEFNIAACYWQDRNMIKYASNPDSDVHRDWTLKLYKLKKDLITSKIRYGGKNNFLFPTLYGSYYENTGSNLWEYAKNHKTAEGQDLPDYLKSVNLNNKNKFINHVKEVEREFHDEFSDFAKGKDKAIRDYEEKGYIELPTGFKIYFGKSGSLTVNNILNTPIQGPAFHCLLWSYNKLMGKKLEDNWNSFIIGQIHDEILFDSDPEEDGYLNPLIKRIMTEDVRKHWPWIVVPLTVEMEESEINGNWFDMKEVSI